jgi:putative hemolysin
VGTTAAAFGGDRMADDLAPALAHVPGVGPHAHQLALALVVAMVSFLSLILGELVPKSLALRAAESYALLIGRPLRMLARAARPLVWLLTASSNAVLRLFGDKTSFTEARLSPEELQELVEEAARAGALDARTSEIASRALEFRDLSAAAVMVPRTEIVAWPVDASPDRLQTLAEETRHARVPVYEGTIDNVVGYVALREMLAIAMRGEALSLRRVMRPVHFVPATIRAVDLLKALQAQRVPLAIVVDEVGGVAGLVTMEDLAEELIGEFIGEHEPPPMAMEPAADGTLMVQGTTPVREVNRALSLELPEGEGWTTLAGLCIHLAGRIPQSGTRITAPDGTVLEVLEASSRRVRSVRVHPRRPDPDAR